MVINSELTRNRAEEYGLDLWGEFVIPLYYPKLELMKSEKPQIIEGGRGSGKTMLLRYLCHDSQFSVKRKTFSEQDFRRIGIYWKMDISFASTMMDRGADEDLWKRAFEHMAVLVLSKEILSSLENIARVKPEAETVISKINFSELNDFDEGLPTEYDQLKPHLKRLYNKFQSWVSNFKRIEQPLFYPKTFLITLIETIREQVPILANSFYSVYFDEYENLNPTQKKIVNTWLKQSQSPLIFNIAMKHQSFDVRETLTAERIVEIHDYRKIDLEDFLKDNFNTFASEIWLLKMNKNGYNILEDDKILYDTSLDALNKRLSKEYSDSIRKKIESIFPKTSAREVAAGIVNEDKLFLRQKNRIEKVLKSRNKENLIPLYLSMKEYPEIFLVVYALLHRTKISVEKIYKEYELYKNGDDSKFSDWIPNNLVGCILNFYGSLNRPCPLYSGNETFITMSKDNIRHYLELCTTSFSMSEDWGNTKNISSEEQSLAVKYVSRNLLQEIRQFGAKGNLLFLFSLRIGNLFEELRKKDSQSEPEQNQFSINGVLNTECREIMKELLKWSVLYESKLTKQKDLESGVEYQFNPIYSSYFTISYRKKRRIELSSDEFNQICFGTDEEYTSLLKKYSSKEIENKNIISEPSLFDVV